MPFAWYKVISASAFVQDWRCDCKVLFGKQHFGVLRYAHFLALAYLAWAAVGPGGERFRQTGWLAAAIALVSRVGQQSLAVFVASMVMARGFGAVLDPWGRRGAGDAGGQPWRHCRNHRHGASGGLFQVTALVGAFAAGLHNGKSPR